MTKSNPLRVVVGVAAIAAPVLHSATDAMEWYRHGFSATQLWLNYVAFLPMPWLLLGIYAVRGEGLGRPALAGALLYGIAFTYFAHTTLLALATDTPNYEALWQRLGATYTLHGALMVAGGLLFAGDALRAGGLPRPAVLLFAAGLLANLVLALVPAPDMLQTLGTALRNAGLVGIGHAILFGRPAAAPE
ncbi:MAG: hypothetical protein JNM82_05805 [Rhodocyclaceae bacterium]|nr:hypothetical protein [Rhodocyclaceae bacterium]